MKKLGQIRSMRSRDVTAIAFNAASYAIFGTITYFGITVWGVKFWPAVAIPAFFSVVFGPQVGGIGAAIGIFISDLITHGDPLLSLFVGVTSNFLGIYIIGYMARKGGFSWRKYITGAILGLAVGSFMIGVGVWGYSYLYGLPKVLGGMRNMETTVILSITLWTFLSEIPFLLTITPALIHAVRLVRPELVECRNDHRS